MTRYRELAAALLLQVIGAGGALLVSIQTWQRLTSAREGPFANAQASMVGRDVDSAITALALVALAGVVAVLATRGTWRRVVGAIVALAGVATIVRAVLSAGAVSNDRALRFIAEHRQTVSTQPGTTVHIDVRTVWPVLTVVCGVLIVLAGAVVAVRGARWQGMSARYERAPQTPSAEDDAARRGKAAASMWSALDRGDDPTES